MVVCHGISTLVLLRVVRRRGPRAPALTWSSLDVDNQLELPAPSTVSVGLGRSVSMSRTSILTPISRRTTMVAVMMTVSRIRDEAAAKAATAKGKVEIQRRYLKQLHPT